METPEPTPVGRRGTERQLSLFGLALGGAAFISLFLPWFGFGGRGESGWNLPLGVELGLLCLVVVLVELLRLAGAWASRGSELLTFCLVAAAGVFGVSEVANLRWGGLTGGGFSLFKYGAWLGLAFAILLIALAGLRWTALRRFAP